MKEFENHKLTNYLDKHVVPLLPKFSRAFIPSFTAGYNVNSISESANSMVKHNLGSVYYTLFEIKDVIRRAYSQKNIIEHQKLINTHKGGSYLEEKFGIIVAPKVSDKLISSLLQAFRLQKVDENHYVDPAFPDEVFLFLMKNANAIT